MSMLRGSTSQPNDSSSNPNSPPTTPESLESLKAEIEALKQENEELKRQRKRQKRSRPPEEEEEEEESDGDETMESLSPPQPPLLPSSPASASASSSSSSSPIPPAKRPRPKDISKRMRDLYNTQKQSHPDLNLPNWDSAAEGYVQILSIPELRAHVSPGDLKKMINSLSKHSAEQLLVWCQKNLFLVDSLPEKSLSAIKRLLTSREESKEFAILSVIPTFIGHNGGLCLITGVFVDQNMCMTDPTQIQVHISIPNHQKMVRVDITDVRPTKFIVVLPSCPFPFPPGQNELPVQLTITIRNQTKSTDFKYIKVTEFDFSSQNPEHSSESAPPGAFQQGFSADKRGGSSQSSSSSPTSGGQGTFQSSVAGRQNMLGQLELHRAAFEGNLERVDQILNETPDDVIVKDNFGRTPAHYAAFSVEKRTLRHLLRAGGSAFTKDCWEVTPNDIYTFQVVQFPKMKPTDIKDLFADDEMTASDDENEDLPVSPNTEKPESLPKSALPPVSPSLLAVQSPTTAHLKDTLKLQLQSPSPSPLPQLGSAMDITRKIVSGGGKLSRSGSIDSPTGTSTTIKKVANVADAIVNPFKALSLNLNPTRSHSCPEDY